MENLRPWLQTPASICLATAGCVTLARLLTTLYTGLSILFRSDRCYPCCHQAVGGQVG